MTDVLHTCIYHIHFIENSENNEIVSSYLYINTQTVDTTYI